MSSPIHDTAGREEVTLSLCMIVRDNADTLAACLSGVKPWVDELVIVDTGSRDNTPDIARGLDARLFHFEWCDDFSAACNEAIKYARGKWLFRLEADETIDAENGQRLRDLAMTDAPDVLGYRVQSISPGPEQERYCDHLAVDVVRLFRNLPDIRWEGRVHEQIMPSIVRAGGTVARSDVAVWHSHSQDPHAPQARLERDLPLFRLELADDPENAFVWFNLGMTYCGADRFEDAVEALSTCVKCPDVNETLRSRACSLLAESLGRLGRLEEAWQACSTGLESQCVDAHLLFRKAILARQMGHLEEAAQIYAQILEHSEPWDCSLGLDLGIVGFKSRFNLARIYAQLGRFPESEKQFRLAVREAPAHRHAWRGLVQVLLAQGRMEQAAASTEQMLRDSVLRPEGMIEQASMFARQGDIAAARRLLMIASEEYPEDADIRTVLNGLLQSPGCTESNLVSAFPSKPIVDQRDEM